MKIDVVSFTPADNDWDGRPWMTIYMDGESIGSAGYGEAEDANIDRDYNWVRDLPDFFKKVNEAETLEIKTHEFDNDDDAWDFETKLKKGF